MNYIEFLKTKKIHVEKSGIESIPQLNSLLKPHQKHTVKFALRQGRSAAFLDTGLGKTLTCLEWGRVVTDHTNKPTLMLAPLAVGQQHEREGDKFGIDSKYIRDPSEMNGNRIYVTNYERLKLFNPNNFGAIILDESSVIKSFTGKTTAEITAFAKHLPFRLAATATPSPNDVMELGQHSNFLDVMASSEMLARWFVTDQSEMGKYRLKKHGIKDFWSWVASWARSIGKPSDVGYCDDGYILPAMKTELHVVRTDVTKGAEEGQMFRNIDLSATSVHKEKRMTSLERAKKIAEVVLSEPNEQWVIWCETDYDAQSIMSLLPEAVEVAGSMKPEVKEQRLLAFTDGNIKILVTKPSIAGFGLNWQNCARTAFVGLSFSYEQYYQAIRRFYRFGQQREVHCHIAIADTELPIWRIVERKALEHETMKREMNEAMKREVLQKGVKLDYNPTQKIILPKFLGA